VPLTRVSLSLSRSALQLYLEFTVFVFRNAMGAGHFGGRRSIKERPPQRTASIFSFHFMSLHVGNNVLIRQQQHGEKERGGAAGKETACTAKTPSKWVINS